MSSKLSLSAVITFWLMLASLGLQLRSKLSSSIPRALQQTANTATSEFLFYSSKSESVLPLKDLSLIRPTLQCMKIENLPSDSAVWSVYRNGIQLDNTILESYWLGKYEYTTLEVAAKWLEAIETRSRLSSAVLSSASSSSLAPLVSFGDGGAFQNELDVAVVAVQAASYMSRSLQTNLLRENMSISKDDRSPVTIADFACQAIVIDALSRYFPGDKFIAEESSEQLRVNPGVREAVLSAIISATGEHWELERLYSTIDKGAFDGTGERIWTLDPVVCRRYCR